MTRWILTLLGVLLASSSTVWATGPTAAPRARAEQAPAFTRPLLFEANHGQASGDAAYLARLSDYLLLLSGDAAVFVLAGADDGPPGGARPRTLRMAIEGADPAAAIEGIGALPGQSHYFIGSEPSQWHTAVPHYESVRSEDVYPGIDLLFYGTAGHLEFDFNVAPGADPARIRLAFTGATSVALDGEDLLVTVGEVEVRFRAPLVYQEGGGTKREISSRYVIESDSRVAFELDDYDPAQPLVIDPVVYSTFLGGNAYDRVFDIDVDAAGSAYVAGYTRSTNFSGGGLRAGQSDAFVTKLDPTGTTVLYSAFIGGSNDALRTFNWGEVAFGIDVDNHGQAHITGETNATNFPTTAGAYQRFARNGNSAATGFWSDVFVTKLSADGASFVYSTLIGRGGQHIGTDIQVHTDGTAYLSVRSNNWTPATSFPVTANAFRAPTVFGNNWDGYFSKLSADGSTLQYSSTVVRPGAGTGDDPNDVAVDAGGFGYIGGTTQAGSIATKNAFDSTPNGGIDGWVAKFDPAAVGADSLIYATYLGSGGNDRVTGFAVNGGNLYISGFTTGTAPAFTTTANAYQSGYGGGGSDAFLTVFDPAGHLVSSTYLGGSSGDAGWGGVALDPSGHPYLLGTTGSGDFPVTPEAIQDALAGGGDLFVAKFEPDLSDLLYATYFGGTGGEFPGGIAVRQPDEVFLGGHTNSASYPVTPGAFDQVFDGPAGPCAGAPAANPCIDGVVTKLTFDGGANEPPAITVNANPLVLEGDTTGGYDNSGGLSAAAAGVVVTDPDDAVADLTLTNDAPALLPLGDTIVTWTAVDPAGAEDMADQTVTVQDTTAPSVTVPEPITQAATSPLGDTIDYVTSADDIVDPDPTLTCAPSSGSTFPLGTTMVACEAEDASGNSSGVVSFDVTLVVGQTTFDGFVTKIEGMGLHHGLENALRAKVQAAAGHFATGEIAEAIDSLNAVLNQIAAQEEKMLTALQASLLRGCATALIDALAVS